MRRALLWTLLAVGLGIAAALAAWVGTAPDRSRLLLVAATELAAGRETALSTALAADVPWPRAATLTTGIEWSMLLVGAPLLILGGDWVRERRLVQRHLAHAEAHARARPRAGVLALAALTLMPFFPLGALTSVLIGEILRLPMRILLPALALAELAANFGFAFLASHAFGLLPDPRMGAAIVAAVLLASIATMVVWRRRRAGAA